MSEPNQTREWKSFATREEADQFWRDNPDYQGVVERGMSEETRHQNWLSADLQLARIHGYTQVVARNIDELRSKPSVAAILEARQFANLLKQEAAELEKILKGWEE